VWLKKVNQEGRREEKVIKNSSESFGCQEAATDVLGVCYFFVFCWAFLPCLAVGFPNGTKKLTRRLSWVAPFIAPDILAVELTTRLEEG